MSEPAPIDDYRELAQSQPKYVGWVLIVLICLSLMVHLWGIRMNLPYTGETDESIFVAGAVHMVASGNLNPGWFGNPGSTIFYPLAGIMHAWRVIYHGAPLLRTNPDLIALFNHNILVFYLLGRSLSIVYGVLCVPSIYLLGKNAFSPQAGLLGAFLFIFYPLAVFHAQLVRTDSAGAFFGILSLWLCLRAYDRPTILNHILAGLAIGLSVSSRYFMVLLVPFLLLLDLALAYRRTADIHPRQLLVSGFVAVAVAFTTFVLSTPYFFLDLSTSLTNLRFEARTIHLGADGLSPLGNFLWYLTSAIPSAISWPQAVLATTGAVVTLEKKQLKPAVLLGFTGIFLVGISLSPLHWERWIIQILPILALFAASAILWISYRLIAFLKLPLRRVGFLVLLIAIAVAMQPAYHLVLQDIQQSNPSTRILARQWILKHIPLQSKIAQEAYTAPLTDTDFQVDPRFSLAADRELSDYYQEGYQYLVISSEIYNRYFAEPGRYTREVQFYEKLFEQGDLLKRFQPSTTRGGPVIQIYRVTSLP